MVKAVKITRKGGPEVLDIVDVDLDAPGAGQALIRHSAAGVNMIDIYHRQYEDGQYGIPVPAILGVEAAGVVEAVGEGVTNVSVGDRVAYMNVLGAYAEKRLIDAEKLVKLPDNVPDDVAAAVMVKGSTAQYLLHSTYAVKSGDTILVHAAAGGVGLILCQWASKIGATVIGTVGTAEKAALAKANGADHTILYRDEDFVACVKEITQGRGVDVVYDSVGQDTFMKSLDCVRPLGMAVNFGQASGPVPPLDISLLAKKGSIFLAKPTLATYTADPAHMREMVEGLLKAIGDGTVKIEVSRAEPMENVASLHRDISDRKTVGSVVLTF